MSNVIKFSETDLNNSIRTYNRGLSDAEILQNWNNQKSRFGY